MKILNDTKSSVDTLSAAPLEYVINSDGQLTLF